jgi:hypothetical protein
MGCKPVVNYRLRDNTGEDFMLQLRTLKDTTSTISDDVLAAFKTSFSGRVIVPGDDAYDARAKSGTASSTGDRA